MRLTELNLEKYGVFDQRGLTFGEAGLTVVFGANEAGKSTSLAAITDFLFGVPDRSPHAAIFGGDAIRIGAVLRSQSGQTLSLRRRKGRTKTLTDSQGAAVDVGVLASLLGGTTRERFETLFGLDHERLRQGGAQLLTADGDIGRLIVEAGGGLRGLVERLSQLDEDIDKLFDTRRSEKRAFYQALDAYDDADRAAKGAMVSLDQYEKAERALEDAEAQLAALTQARSNLAADAARLERLARVAPILRNLDMVRAQLAAVPALGLPQNFDRQVTEAKQAKALAAQALSAAWERREALQVRLLALGQPIAMTGFEARVRDASERAIHVAKAREDRPNRCKELADSNQQLESLRRRLKLSVAEDLAPRLPTSSAIESVRELAVEAERRAPTILAAEQRLLELDAEERTLSAATAAAAERGHDRPAGVSVAELAAVPGALQGVDNRRRAADDALAKAQVRARGLGYDGLEALQLERFPSSDVLTQESVARETLSAERVRLISQRAEAERLDGAATGEIARLTEGAAVASDTALADARQRRTEALAPLRATHLSGQTATVPEVRQAEVEGVDEAVRMADEIADRHAAEAQRAATLAQAIKQQATARSDAAAAAKALAALDANLAQRDQALAGAFPQAVERFVEFIALKSALEERVAVLALWSEGQSLAESAKADEALLSGQLQILDLAERKCRLSPLPLSTIAERVRAALTALSELEQGHAAYRRDLTELARVESARAAAAQALEGLRRDAVAWTLRWAPSLAALGLDPTTSPDQATAAAMEWASAQGVLTTIETTQRRLDRMSEDAEALTSAVSAMGRDLGLALPDDEVAAAKMLEARWREHEDVRRHREQLEPELASAARAHSEAETALEAAESALQSLSHHVGSASLDLDALDLAAEAHATRRQLGETERALIETFGTAGDFKSETELREAWAERDVDVLRAEHAIAQDGAERADADRLAAFEAVLAARSVLAAYQSQAGVNSAVIAREAATAELHRVVERYIDLSLARDLIRDAIDKVRARQQDPLVARAGALFKAMTQGAYVGVGADIDAKGNPVVVGHNVSGSDVLVSKMSDGTRDQLYLAFRLAGLESYCAATEPLPFIADDILVHFDDARSTVTLEVLAAFGSTTQVLLFTHHDSIRQAALRLAETGQVQVLEMG